MLKTFNCGIGMVAVVAADQAEALESLLAAAGESVVRLGRVQTGQGVAYSGSLA
jgi:phosphoribosylformylglycinamidine cyclo-ligase